MTPAADVLADTLRGVRWRFIVARVSDAAWAAVMAALAAGTVARAGGFGAAWPAAVAGTAGVALAWRNPPTATGAAAWLDRRHGLADLLTSAWTTRHRRDEPWAAALGARATATAAALPPASGLARFPARLRACGLATAVALWLAAGLVPGRAGAGRAAPDAVAIESAGDPEEAAQQVAREFNRRPDTADDSAATPGPAESTAAGRPARAAEGKPASQGRGRADAAALTALPPPDAGPKPPGRASPGRADGAPDDEFAPRRPTTPGRRAGVVQADRGTAPRFPSAGVAPSVRDDRVAPTPATPVPAAYRDLVGDFFAR